MKRAYKLFIQDILDAINRIEKFVDSMSYEEFFYDDRTKSAVVWQIILLVKLLNIFLKKLEKNFLISHGV